MTDDKLKQLIRETLEPMFDELVELNFKVFCNLTNNLPAEMPEEQKLDLIKGVLKSHGEALAANIKASVPTDFDTMVKEAYDDRGRS